MKGLFDSYRDKEMSLAGLASASARISRKLGFRSEDRRVGTINERTLRYYQGRDLLDPPLRSGREGRYSLLHLLQVLTLRQFQAEGYSLDGIKELIDQGELPWKSVSSLERAITLAGRAAQRSSAEEPEAADRSTLRPGDARKGKPARRGRRPVASASVDYMAAPPPAGSQGADTSGAVEEELIHRVAGRVGVDLMKYMDHRLARFSDTLNPRIESMLEQLLARRLEPGEHCVTREVRPGVSVQIDTKRVEDPEEVLGRIEEAISDDG